MFTGEKAREEPLRCELLRAARGAPEEVLALVAPSLGKLQAPWAQEALAVGVLEEPLEGSFNKTQAAKYQVYRQSREDQLEEVKELS